MDEGVLFGSACAAAEAVRHRDISARELTEAALARTAAVNPGLNAVVGSRAESALAEAAAADDDIARGAEVGPLHGVPITIKDAFQVAGVPTTWGNPDWRDAVAGRDATVVARLRRAGAIVLGTTNPAFMLADFGQTANPLFGTTNNPWNRELSAGGSSGGSAAAVAAGLSFLDYGTDLAGSIRIPAAYCGVYGLRPTEGTVPATGMQPPGPPADQPDPLGTVGPLARTAGDLRAALRITGGPEGTPARAYRWGPAPPRHDRLDGFRVGLVLDHPAAPVASDVGRVLSDLADAVSSRGVRVVEGWPPGVDPAADQATFGYLLELFLARAQPGPSGLGDVDTLLGHERRRAAVRSAWERGFRDIDVFVSPVSVIAAFPHDERPFEERTIVTDDGERPYTDQAFWITYAGLAGLPAVSAPAGSTAAGLPVGVQIVGPTHEDDTAITFAGLLADVAGGYRRPPG